MRCAFAIVVWWMGAFLPLTGCQSEEPAPMMDIRRMPRESAKSADANSLTDQGAVLDLETSLDKTVTVGETLLVSFASNAGTGYEWKCQLTDDPFIAVDEPPEIAPVDTGIVGGRIRTIFRLHGKSVGAAKVTFVLVRPWERDVPPAKTLTLTLNVINGALPR